MCLVQWHFSPYAESASRDMHFKGQFKPSATPTYDMTYNNITHYMQLNLYNKAVN